MQGPDPSHRTGDWLIPAGLLTLGLVPMVMGVMRLAQFGGAAAATADSARFFASPGPVAVHIVSVLTYGVLGAFQFPPGLRRRNPEWHRAAGRLLVACGLVAAMSALWMTLFYPRGIEPPARFDGPWLDAIRLLAATAMALCLGLGLAAALRRDIPHHSAWMMRAYAIGLGAGTQVLTHLPWFLFPSVQGELARTLCMGAGWALNLALAEWLIARGRRAAPAVDPATQASPSAFNRR